MLPYLPLHPLFLIAGPVVFLVLCLVCFPKTFFSCDDTTPDVFEIPREDQLILKMYQQRYTFSEKKESLKGVFIEQVSPAVVVIPLSVQTKTLKDQVKDDQVKDQESIIFETETPDVRKERASK